MFNQVNDLTEALPPLPKQDEFEGYDWIDKLQGGWVALGTWGSMGWDLGQWPYTIAAICRVKGPLWGLAVYTEGDISLWGFRSRDELFDEIDTRAEFWWRMGYGERPEDLPEKGLKPEHRGPCLD